MKQWCEGKEFYIAAAAVVVVLSLLYWVIGPAIAKPYHEDRLHKQQVCEDAGGRLVNAYGGLACVKDLDLRSLDN